MLCSYYQAHVDEKNCWFLVAIMRSFEHLAFDRTLDKENSIFEFFVPSELENVFLEVMNYFEEQKIVHSMEKLPNRLSDPHAFV